MQVINIIDTKILARAKEFRPKQTGKCMIVEGRHHTANASIVLRGMTSDERRNLFYAPFYLNFLNWRGGGYTSTFFFIFKYSIA